MLEAFRASKKLTSSGLQACSVELGEKPWADLGTSGTAEEKFSRGLIRGHTRTFQVGWGYSTRQMLVLSWVLSIAFTLMTKVTGRTRKAYKYLMPLSAALRQAGIQQISETLEGALPTDSNIWKYQGFHCCSSGAEVSGLITGEEDGRLWLSQVSWSRAAVMVVQRRHSDQD